MGQCLTFEGQPKSLNSYENNDDEYGKYDDNDND